VYLDFFPTSIQRLALRTVANLCVRVPKDHEAQLLDAAPALTNLMAHPDGRMVESATLAIARGLESLAEAYGKSASGVVVLRTA
jgi:E3 ubiquitin-protein ligase TRIP12